MGHFSRPPTITTARRSLAEDIASRRRRYLISMTVRGVCFVAAVMIDGWLRWVFAAGAIVLPYVAVLIANAGREPGATPDGAYRPLAIASGPADEADDSPDGPRGEAIGEEEGDG